jgi:hypothetical protein
MSDPKNQSQPDELETREAAQDLEPSDEMAEQVRAGTDLQDQSRMDNLAIQPRRP